MAFVGCADLGAELVAAGKAVGQVLVAQARVQSAALGQCGVEVGRGAVGEHVGAGVGAQGRGPR